MSKPIITVQHVFKSFGHLKAVDDLSFGVHSGTCFGFLGPNGAGKTTMMKMIYGRSLRDRGESDISVFGFDPARNELDIKFISGVVTQEDNLDEELNVTQNLRMYAKFYGMHRKEAKDRIDDLLTFFELSEKRKGKIRELSGGMKRRLVIARALLHTPRLLILDEPTTGLDPQVRHLIWEKLRQLKKQGLTILLTTHYMEEAYQLCDNILIMDKGRKMIEGEPRLLLQKNIEQYVLEVLSDEAAKDLEGCREEKGVRSDMVHGRPVFYADRMDNLKCMADRLKHGEFNLRQANLEDLFLKLTGRELNVHQ